MIDFDKITSNEYRSTTKEELSAFVERGELIYQEKYKSKIEEKYKGKIAAIDIISGTIFIADTKLEAYAKGQKVHPGRAFYFVKIGGVFKRRRAR